MYHNHHTMVIRTILDRAFRQRWDRVAVCVGTGLELVCYWSWIQSSFDVSTYHPNYNEPILDVSAYEANVYTHIDCLKYLT